MSIKRLLVAIIILISIGACSARTHKVIAGDTLYSISRKYNLTLRELRQKNKLNDNTISVGQMIEIPEAKAMLEPRVQTYPKKEIPKDGYHSVEQGDTLFRISKMYDVLITDILDFNELENSYITEGQKIWLKSHDLPKKKPAIIHTVKKGDTISKISRDTGLTIKEIKAFNKLKSNSIYIGQKLLLGEGKLPKDSGKPKTRKKNPTYVRSDLMLPTDGVVTSEFGLRNNVPHKGIDIGAPYGTPIIAVTAGTVIFEGMQRGYGNVIVLEHENHVMTVYAHNEKNLSSLGKVVKKGEQIATVGSTGNSTAPHLHFEYRIKGKAIDPREVLKGLAKA
ncbi:MAG: LysM peptidoglycan-binding domain-containing protein [Candidatus Zophobacter franzmannii]|nr:LysM peptidoglycan-binding domain-containing protein [Candidatus Zophobacter franzmannii]